MASKQQETGTRILDSLRAALLTLVAELSVPAISTTIQAEENSSHSVPNHNQQPLRLPQLNGEQPLVRAMEAGGVLKFAARLTHFVCTHTLCINAEMY